MRMTLLSKTVHPQVAADVSRRHLRCGKNAPTDVGGYNLLERSEQSRGQVFMTATAESWPQETGRELHRWRVKEGSLLIDN